MLVEREALAGEGGTGEGAREPLAPVVVVGLEPDLGVERKIPER